MGESILATLVVSLVSLVGIVAFKWKKFKKYVSLFVAFAAGTLIADACLHIIPEASELEGFSQVGALIFLGSIVFSFLLEGVLRWHHSHDVDAERHVAHLGYMSLISDFIHNFVDGVVIAAAFALNPTTGIATTLAVIFHEIPHEIGNYATLIYAGFERKKALLYNFLSSLSALLGVIVTTVLITQTEGVVAYVSFFAAGSLLYIALADMVPEVQKSHGKSISPITLLAFCLGVAVIALLLLFESH